MNKNGCGLGLSISKKIVEMFGGQMKVESIVGVGSEFIFSVNIHINEINQNIFKTSLQEPKRRDTS